MINILMFGMSSYPGGIESYIVNTFCNDVVSKQVHIDFIAYEDKLAYENEIRKFGYSIIYVPHLKKKPMRYWKSIKHVISQNHYDCVYVNMLTAANVLPVKLARKFGAKEIIIHAHANSTIKGVIRRALHIANKKYCNKTVTLRLACSQEAADWLYDKNINDSPIVVIPNAINTKRFSFSETSREEIRNKYNIQKTELLLGSVGRLGPEKNNQFMIEILQSMIEKGMDAKLLLVGDGTMKEQLILQSGNLGLRERVILAGTCSNTEDYYSAFDVFLFPSQFEGFGISALEAQSCGLLCLCSDQLSKELNVSGKAVFLPINSGVECWVNAIEQLGNKPFDRAEMNMCIKNSDYSVEKQNEIILNLLLNNGKWN